MDTGTPTPGGSGSTDALTALRTASARVAELVPEPTSPGTDEADDHAFDAAEHAGRFEDLHEALSAVLDDLDRG